MINKTDVSHLITGLRPKIKQSAIHLAHHHTQEIKKLEKRKGDKAERFKKKAENLRKEAALIKTIQPDEVSRYAMMMNFSDREKLLNDINLPLETKVTVRLATHKNVVEHIENFRKGHAEWKDKLPNLLKTLGICTQHKKKVEKQQERSKRKLARKQALEKDAEANSPTTAVNNGKASSTTTKVSQKVTAKKIPSSLKEATAGSDASDAESEIAESDNTEEGNEHSDAESDLTDAEVDQSDAEIDQSDAESDESNAKHDEFDADSGESDAESGESDAESGESDAESDHSDAESNQSDAESNQSDAESNRFIPVISSNSKLNNKLPGKPKGPRISKASSFAEVRRFAELGHEAHHEKERKLDCASSLPIEDLSDKEAIEEDTFFMTGENKFLKTIAVKREDGEGLHTDKKADKKTLWDLDWKKNQTGNRAERRAKLRGDFNYKKPRDTNQKNDSREFSKIPNQAGKNSKNFDKVSSNSANSNSRNPKQFDSISHGKGKMREFSKFNKKELPSNKPISQSAETNTDKGLHPSWEAKRKQKVSLDCFQGKKIKFDD